MKCATPVGSEAFFGTRTRACSFGSVAAWPERALGRGVGKTSPPALHALALLLSGAAPDAASFGGERELEALTLDRAAGAAALCAERSSRQRVGEFAKTMRAHHFGRRLLQAPRPAGLGELASVGGGVLIGRPWRPQPMGTPTKLIGPSLS